MAAAHISGALAATRVLVVGVSTRAAAESAARAGFEVTAVDWFGDLDQHASVRAVGLPRSFSAYAAARVARSIESDVVSYLSSFENHPEAVSTLATGRVLWGNTPAVLTRVRDPMIVARTLRGRGRATPAVCGALEPSYQERAHDQATLVELPYDAERGRLSTCSASSGSVASPVEPSTGARCPGPGDGWWLVKPLASGGGHRVRLWRRTRRPPRGCYLQEFIEGTPGSVVFVAAGGCAVPIGISRQLVGEPAFGATGFRYCGNILAAADDAQFARDEALVDAARELAQAVTEEFGVVGVNGIDFVARDGVPYAIEVNPRWCASMELVEQAYGLSVFGAHAAACAAGALPRFDLAQTRRSVDTVGKAVVFARRDVTVGDTRSWLANARVRDVPAPGTRILAGRPVCTVFAVGRDAVSCHSALVRRAERVYAELGAWERGPRHGSRAGGPEPDVA